MNFRFSRLPRVHRIASAIAGAIAIFICGFFAGDFFHNSPNPAPLGRTDAEVTRTLKRELPVGESVDGAVTYLAGEGVTFTVIRTANALATSHASDSGYAGGAVIRIIERDVEVGFFTTKAIQVSLYFDTSDRLVRRDVSSVFTGM